MEYISTTVSLQVDLLVSRSTTRVLIVIVVGAADSGNVWDATVIIWTHITLRPGLRQKPSSSLLLLTTVTIIYSTTKSSCKL